MINSVATGAALAMMDFKLQPVLDCLQEQFQQKGAEMVENNQKSATAGYDFVQQNFKAKPPFKAPDCFDGSREIVFEYISKTAVCVGKHPLYGYALIHRLRFRFGMDGDGYHRDQ